ISLPPPPRPTPPPPRSKSSTSRSPSPTSTFSSSTHPLSPHLIVNGDVDEFIGSPKKLVHPPRSSSPVSTLSPPRTRYGQVISNEHLISTDPNDSQHSSHLRTDSGPINTKLSINTNTQFRQQRLIPPTRRTDERNSIRQSIPIMMPTSLFKTSTSSSTLNKHNILVGTSLPPPPRSLYRVPIHLPPSIPLPLPPPRPKSTMTQNSVPRLPQITPRISKDTSMKSPTRSSSHSSNSMYHVNQLPPPSRPPPTIPLPPIPVESTKNVISNEIIIEFPDEDDLDPDYAEELEAS
ncbi:9811_t:CDS:1, partial [Scutellospora calospora]